MVRLHFVDESESDYNLIRNRVIQTDVAAMTFAIGETVGAYLITERLGQGGMAAVYRAYHAKLDRYVAIKVLHPAYRDDTNFLARFQREAQIVARLEHPHIVPIYDSADHEGQPYLVMKFIDGQTLKAQQSEAPLALAAIVPLMTAIGGALTYAHEQGVLHRDIKPSNILLEKVGTPYLADFGLARMVGAGESTMSQDMMLGTPQYISPEQAQGVPELDAGTDIYSLGVVLYELLVGRVPFSADTPYAIVHDQIYAPLPLPSLVNPAVPPAIENVLLKALAKERHDRYESAVQMVTALRVAVEESPDAARAFDGRRAPIAPRSKVAPATNIIATPAPAGSPSLAATFSSVLSPSTLTPAPAFTQPLIAPPIAEPSKPASGRHWARWGCLSLIVVGVLGVLLAGASARNKQQSIAALPSASAVPTRTPSVARPTRSATSPATVTSAPTNPVTAFATPSNITSSTLSGTATAFAQVSIPGPLSFDAAQSLVTADSTNPANWFALTLASIKEKRPSKVQDTFSKAVELTGENVPILMAAIRAFATAHATPYTIFLEARLLSIPTISGDVYDTATYYLYQRAKSPSTTDLAAFSNVTRSFPQLADGIAFAALAASNTNHPDEATLAIAVALRMSTDRAEIHLAQAIILVNTNRATDAIQELHIAQNTSHAPHWVINESTAILAKLSATATPQGTESA